jgi:hypothetical protein
VISPRMARLPVSYTGCIIADVNVIIVECVPLLWFMLRNLLCRMRFGRQCSCTSLATALMCTCTEGGIVQ